MKKRLKALGALIVLAFMAMQLTNPSHQNPPVAPGHDLLASNAPPPAVAALLKNACYDCHSYETKWPWYSYIAPISWYVARDVEAARASLNFSDWPHDDPKRIRKRWEHIADDIENLEMPPPHYMRLHSQAQLDAPTRAKLLKWTSDQGK